MWTCRQPPNGCGPPSPRASESIRFNKGLNRSCGLGWAGRRGRARRALGATALVAQTDPIAARKAVMKANGDQSKIATDMLEGKAPFNLEAAKKIFATFAEAEKVKTLFPDNSKTGGDTAALPAIWENK